MHLSNESMKLTVYWKFLCLKTNYEISDFAKLKWYLLFIISSFLLPSCQKLSELTQFEMVYNESVVIPKSTALSLPFNLMTPEVASNAESTFAVNDTRKDLVEEIVLTQLELKLTAPENGNLGFLKSIEILIAAEGLEDTKIAWKDPVPKAAGKSLVLDCTGANLKDYIVKDAFKLKVNTITDELLTADHHIDLKAVFFVDARILGQ